MVETEALRQKILALSGTPLVFEAGTIFGFPGFSMSHLYNGEASVYIVENPQYNFTFSTKDLADNEITIDALFTLTDSIYEYEFKIDNNPISFLDGWSKLDANLLGRTAL